MKIGKDEVKKESMVVKPSWTTVLNKNPTASRQQLLSIIKKLRQQKLKNQISKQISKA